MYDIYIMKRGSYTMDYNQYLEECKKIKERNYLLLDLFKDDLIQSGLKDKTISRHLSNVEFYINEFLLYRDAYPMEEGLNMLDDYLGDFYIRKCLWSTPGNIKSTAASIKKFYKSMLAHGEIDKAGYHDLCSLIKDSMEVWQTDCAIYNDPESTNPFFPF